MLKILLSCHKTSGSHLQRNQHTCIQTSSGREDHVCFNSQTCKTVCPQRSWPWSRWAVRSLRNHTAWSRSGSSPGCLRAWHLKEGFEAFWTPWQRSRQGADKTAGQTAAEPQCTLCCLPQPFHPYLHTCKSVFTSIMRYKCEVRILLKVLRRKTADQLNQTNWPLCMILCFSLR